MKLVSCWNSMFIFCSLFSCSLPRGSPRHFTPFMLFSLLSSGFPVPSSSRTNVRSRLPDFKVQAHTEVARLATKKAPPRFRDSTTAQSRSALNQCHGKNNIGVSESQLHSLVKWFSARAEKSSQQLAVGCAAVLSRVFIGIHPQIDSTVQKKRNDFASKLAKTYRGARDPVWLNFHHKRNTSPSAGPEHEEIAACRGTFDKCQYRHIFFRNFRRVDSQPFRWRIAPRSTICTCTERKGKE